MFKQLKLAIGSMIIAASSMAMENNDAFTICKENAEKCLSRTQGWLKTNPTGDLSKIRKSMSDLSELISKGEAIPLLGGISQVTHAITEAKRWELWPNNERYDDELYWIVMSLNGAVDACSQALGNEDRKSIINSEKKVKVYDSVNHRY